MPTPVSKRAQPQQVFNEYTLSKFVSPELMGLTDVPYSAMSQILAAGASAVNSLAETIVDLGQTFTFDGRHFGQALVSTSGLVMFGVPASGSFAGLDTTSVTTMPAELTPSGSFILAPWWGIHKTVPAATSPNGGVWFKYDTSHDAARSIIRWNAEFFGNSNTFEFECVLYSNGKIEYRYAPYTKVTSAGSSTAVIGVFATGSNQFRDFTRAGALGGATYDPNYADGAVPYNHSTALITGWPGGTSAGAQFTFQPRQALRKVAPRLTLREHDASSALLEGTDRSSLFDDRRSIAFVSGVFTTSTQLPLEYLNSAPGGAAARDLSTQFFLTGSVQPSAVEQWLEPRKRPVRSATPFADHAHPEQGPAFTGSFYATGSAVTVTEGFTSPLRSKTTIKIELPVLFATALPAQTASIYYYDKRTSKMLQISATDLQAPSTSLKPEADAKLFGPMGLYVSSGTISTVQTATPFWGNHPSWNSLVNAGSVADALQFVQTGSVTLNSRFDPKASNAATIDMGAYIDRPFVVEKAFIEVPLEAGAGWLTDLTSCLSWNTPDTDNSPSADQTVDVGGPCITVGLMNNLSPTLRDVVLSGTIIPIGDSIQRAKFTYYQTSSYVIGQTVYEHTIQGFPAFGGTPSAVVSPNAVSLTQFTGSAQVVTDARVTSGFRSVFSNGQAPDVSITSPTLWSASEFATDVLQLSDISTHTFGAVDPGGRNKRGDSPAGRSIFGRDTAAAVYKDNKVFNVVNPFSASRADALAQFAASSQFTGSYSILGTTVHHVGSTQASPYLLTPTDQLTFFVAKHRPAKSATSRASSSGFANVYTDPHSAILTGSHDVKIATGTISITLYGSYVVGGAESHSRRTVGLQTPSVMSDIIGSEISDQFAVSYLTEFSGSTFDDYMTGSIAVKNVDGSITISRRERAFSVSNARAASYLGTFTRGRASELLIQPYELAGITRNSQCTSTSERFYDSLVPNIGAVMHADGSELTRYSSTFVQTGQPAWVVLDASGSSATTGDTPRPINNNSWSRAFPFESRYSSAARQTSLSQGLITKYWYNGASAPVLRAAQQTTSIIVAGAQADVPAAPTAIEYALVCDFLSGVLSTHVIEPPASDSIKTLYGFGDNDLRFTVNGLYFGPSNFPTFRGATIATFGSRGGNAAYNASPVIRGWKYGLVNGLPQYTKAIFNRNHFGQFRDMLEQRCDTKFFASTDERKRAPSAATSPVTVRFLSTTGQLTDPASTQSQNLSFEATSSMPFFDGETRNRDAINTSTLNHSPFTVGADALGNVVL